MRFISFILIFLAQLTFGQSTTDFSKLFLDDLYESSTSIGSYNPMDVNFQDLDPIGRSIADASIVLLGEPSHGDGGAIQMKTRLVKYLHEQKGFDVLLFEADFYAVLFGVAQARDTQEVMSLVRQNIYTCWTESQVSQELWNYYLAQLETDNPLTLAAMDVRHAGAFSKTRLVGHLDRVLESIDFNVSSQDYLQFKQDLNYLLENEFGSKQEQVDARNFMDMVNKIKQAISFNNLPVDQRNLLLIEINNIKNLFEYLILGKNRDIMMAENFVFLSKYIFPDKKIMVWSHNNHNALDVNMYASFNPDFSKNWHQENTYQGFTYFGSDIFREFGQRVYSLAITSSQGNYSPAFFGSDYFHADFSKTAKVLMSNKGSLEHYLQDKKSENRFIALPKAQGKPSGYPWFSARLLDLGYEAKMDYTSSFHGIIYLESTVDLNGN
ncbi:erythromycin esterase family protein [Myroides sp. LJL119]